MNHLRMPSVIEGFVKKEEIKNPESIYLNKYRKQVNIFKLFPTHIFDVFFFNEHNIDPIISTVNGNIRPELNDGVAYLRGRAGLKYIRCERKVICSMPELITINFNTFLYTFIIDWKDIIDDIYPL